MVAQDVSCGAAVLVTADVEVVGALELAPGGDNRVVACAVQRPSWHPAAALSRPSICSLGRATNWIFAKFFKYAKQELRSH